MLRLFTVFIIIYNCIAPASAFQMAAIPDCTSDRMLEIAKDTLAQAEQNDRRAQYVLGIYFLHGYCGYSQDLVQSYKWMVIAYENSFNNDLILDERDGLIVKLSAEQISEARRMAFDWLRLQEEKFYQDEPDAPPVTRVGKFEMFTAEPKNTSIEENEINKKLLSLIDIYMKNPEDGKKTYHEIKSYSEKDNKNQLLKQLYIQQAQVDEMLYFNYSAAIENYEKSIATPKDPNNDIIFPDLPKYFGSFNVNQFRDIFVEQRLAELKYALGQKDEVELYFAKKAALEARRGYNTLSAEEMMSAYRLDYLDLPEEIIVKLAKVIEIESSVPDENRVYFFSEFENEKILRRAIQFEKEKGEPNREKLSTLLRLLSSNTSPMLGSYYQKVSNEYLIP